MIDKSGGKMVFLRRIPILIFILVLCFPIAIAAEFDIETTPITDRILLDEFAKFQIKIKNNLAEADEYRIYTANFPTWDVRTEPLINPITLAVGPNQEGIIEILIDPLKIKDIGTYAINLNIRSAKLNELKTVPVEVTVLSTTGLIQGYVPTITTSVGIPEKIDPRKDIPIRIVLNNQNVVNYSEIEVRVESSIISKRMTTELGPKEEKTLEFTTSIDPVTAPQKDRVTVSLYTGGKSIINTIVKDIELIEYAEARPLGTAKRPLMTTTDYELFSNNPSYEGPFRIETTLLGSIFSSESPNAKPVIENGKRYLEWNVKVEDHRLEASVTKNFIPALVVILVLLGLGAAYYMFRSPLQIRKETSNIVKKEGGVSEMTVLVQIRNHGQGRITDIDLTETIPSIVSIERDVSIGSLQPNKILGHEKKGTTIVKWNIEALDPGEERVLSYKIKTRLSILGSFSFPVAAASFKYNGKTYTSTSNRLNVEG